METASPAGFAFLLVSVQVNFEEWVLRAKHTNNDCVSLATVSYKDKCTCHYC
jgi:Cu2+-containing amine oxidase